MPNDPTSPSLAERVRTLAIAERAGLDRFQEVRDALARCASEDITPYEWAKMRAGLVDMLDKTISGSGDRIAFLDAIAEAVDERRDPRRADTDSVRGREI